MKLSEFLKNDGIDIYSNQDPLANEIKFNTSNFVDMEKDINDLTDDEIYQVFAHLRMIHTKGKPYLFGQIVEFMKNEFGKVRKGK
jgi:hypothetical protein